MFLETLLPSVLSKVIDKIFPNTAEAEKAKAVMQQMAQDGELKLILAEAEVAKAQIALNVEEARSESLFKSGARPFILWGTGIAFLMPIFFPYLSWLLKLVGVDAPPLPVVNPELYTGVLVGLLGLAGIRSFDKVKNLK